MIWRSTGGGQTWVQSGAGVTAPDNPFQVQVFAPADDGYGYRYKTGHGRTNDGLHMTRVLEQYIGDGGDYACSSTDGGVTRTGRRCLTAFVIASIGFFVGACGSTDESPVSHAVSKQSVTETTSSAPPADFPDLSTYTPVDVQTYVQSYPYFNGFGFTTPDGQQCGHNEMNSLDDPARLTLSCEGPRPDKGPGTWEVRVATDEPATMEQSTVPLNPADTQDPSMTPKQLAAMHKITYEGIECGVDDTGTTACLVGDHGFVLTPTSTELF